MNQTIQTFDESFFLTLNGSHSDFFDSIMLWASNLFVFIPLFIIITFIAIRYYKNNGAYHPIASALLLTGVLGLIYVICVDVMPYVFSFFYDREKPCLNPNIASMVRVVGEDCNYNSVNNFFAIRPCIMFCVVSFISNTIKNDFSLFKILIVFFAILVAYSRIYLGIHYPLNVFIGIIIGLFLGYIASKLFFYIKNQVLIFN